MRAIGRGAVRFGASLLRRGYALALAVIIVWLSYHAIAYLIHSLVTPTQSPAQVEGVPLRLDEQWLHKPRPDWLGLQVVENPRSPLSRYHRLDSWLQHDAVNDCTRSGCHAPLPHARRKEVRAFLNMHATTLHCGVCHFVNEEARLKLTWYDIEDGARRDPPALLRAYAWLHDHVATDDATYTPEDQDAIVALLTSAADESNGDAGLRRSAAHLRAVRAEAPSFKRLLGQAHDVVERSLRGSYGAKLALLSDGGTPLLAHPDTADAAETFLREGASVTDERREKLIDQIHPLRRQMAVDCHACHTASDSHIDFAALGYPPERERMLVDPIIGAMIEHIADGKPFYMPQLSPPHDP
jgi:hypothetical protein